MDLTNKIIIKGLLKRHGAKPEKYLGQHFILSKKALAKMIEAAEIKKNDTVVEIGPGLGTLTQELVKIPHPLKKGRGLKIIAIEKDPLMVSILKETLVNYKNVEIIQADARNLKVSETYKIGDKVGIKIVANLPYNVATFLIRQWLELRKAPELMVLMVQKEVAQRICAKPPHMNLLAVSVQFLATAKIIDYVPAEAFWPKPKIDSAIIKIVPYISNSIAFASDRKKTLQVVKAGFSQPRKQLIGNLIKKLKIPRGKLIELFKNLNISERARAENLSLDQWLSLAISLHLTTQKK